MSSEKNLSKLDSAGHVEKQIDESALSGEEESEPFTWKNFDVVSNLIALLCCFFAATWGLAVPNSAISFIVDAYPQGASKAAWIAAAVTIPNCVVQTFIGDLSDIFGRRIFLFIGMASGFAGQMIASRATSIEMVIGGQVLNGIGFTLGYLVFPLLAEMVPKESRAIVQALASTASTVAYCAGPIVQGAFIKNDVGGVTNGWRGGFYMGAALYGFSFIATAVFYHPAHRPNPNKLSVLQRFLNVDWVGIFLVTCGLTVFLVGLQYGGNPYQWDSARVLACLIVGGAVFVGFVVWEWKAWGGGLMPRSLFVHRNYALCCALSFVGGFVLFGGQAYLPQEIVVLLTADAVLTGVYNLPFNLGTMIGSAMGGVIIARTKEAKWVVVTAMGATIVGAGLMAVMEPHISYAAYFFPAILLGMSVGVQVGIVIVVVSICTPGHLIATAVAWIGAIRAAGGSIGVIIYEQIFASKVKVYLPKQVAKAILENGLPPSSVVPFLTEFAAGNIELLEKVPGVTLKIISAAGLASAQAYADSYRFVWYSLIPFAVVAFVLSLWLKSTKDQMTSEVVAGVQKRHVGGH